MESPLRRPRADLGELATQPPNNLHPSTKSVEHITPMSELQKGNRIRHPTQTAPKYRGNTYSLCLFLSSSPSHNTKDQCRTTLATTRPRRRRRRASRTATRARTETHALPQQESHKGRRRGAHLLRHSQPSVSDIRYSSQAAQGTATNKPCAPNHTQIIGAPTPRSVRNTNRLNRGCLQIVSPMSSW